MVAVSVLQLGGTGVKKAKIVPRFVNVTFLYIIITAIRAIARITNAHSM